MTCTGIMECIDINSMRRMVIDAQSLTLEEADRVAQFENSYSRLESILYMFRKLQYGKWLSLLGEWWSSCDNIWRYRLPLRRILGTAGPLPELMTTEEQAALAVLPDTITVYRGCGEKNILGASWTTDRDAAAEFPFLSRYEVKEPLLVTATVKKKNVLAYKQGRDEQEVITFSARRISVELVTMPESLRRLAKDYMEEG